jgi:homeobox KN domain-containing protein
VVTELVIACTKVSMEFVLKSFVESMPSNAHYVDRPLKLIPPKGRPVKQCEPCRTARKSKCPHTRYDYERKKKNLTTIPINNPKHKRRQIKFSINALQTLENWFNAHRENPYPTEDERIELVKNSGLTKKQVNIWLANARKRNMDATDPLSMYLSCSSDDEAAPIEAIRAAAASNKLVSAPPTLEDSFLYRNYSASQSESSMNSMFNQDPSLGTWRPPPRRGRKKYTPSLHSSASSAGLGSVGSVDNPFGSGLLREGSYTDYFSAGVSGDNDRVGDVSFDSVFGDGLNDQYLTRFGDLMIPGNADGSFEFPISLDEWLGTENSGCAELNMAASNAVVDDYLKGMYAPLRGTLSQISALSSQFY